MDINEFESNIKASRDYFGKSYTYFNPDERIIGTGIIGMTFMIHPNSSYHVTVSDPIYFLGSDSPIIYPRIQKLYWVMKIIKLI